jgi:Tol biopolymer transport system component
VQSGAKFGAAVLTAVAGLALVPPVAGATFPGTNGKIAFVRDEFGMDEEIFVINPDGSDAVALTSNSLDEDYDPSFSADGEKIAFGRGPVSGGGSPGSIWVMNSAGGEQTQLTFSALPQDDVQPAFSPDGDRIAFVRGTSTDPEIFLMNANGSNQAPLTDNALADSEPQFSPDGQRIVFVRNDGSDTEIFIMNSDGSGQTPLTDNSFIDEAPSFSPDGQKIVYVRHEGPPDREIFVMNPDGSNQTPLTSSPEENFRPVFSPDGEKVAFTRVLPTAVFTLFTMNADGSAQAPLTGDPAFDDTTPDWQPLNPPACDLSAPTKQKSFGVVTTAITCSENARVEASGQGKAPRAPKLATISKAKRFTLEPTTVEVQADQPTVLTLTVPKKGKKALKKAAKAGKKGKATVTTTATDDLGETTQDSLAVKFKKKK